VGPDVSSTAIKNTFMKLGPKLRFIEHDADKKGGYIRYTSEADARLAVEKINTDKLVLGGQEISAIFTEGEEHEKCIQRMQQGAHNKFQKKKEERKNHSEEGKSYSEDSHGPPKRQKKENTAKIKDTKEKGRKVGNISDSKPKQHKFFKVDDQS